MRIPQRFLHRRTRLRTAVLAAGLLVLPAAGLTALQASGSGPVPGAALHQPALGGAEPAAVAPVITRVSLGKEISPARSGGTTALTARHATGAFQTVGATWRGRALAPDLRISVRTRQAGVWGGWQQLDSEAGDDTLATKGVRGGTDPVWVGPSDGVQAKVVSRSGILPPDLRLDLVDPGRSGYDDVAVSGLPGAYGGASVAQPVIVTRAQWGADESRVRCAPTYSSTVKAVVMHHTAGANGYAAGQVPAIIRGDYAYHLSRGWCDIGYNALVDRFGRIWEGRAGGLDRAVVGAHAGGFNVDTFGVSVIGNYDTARPTEAAVAAVARVFAWKLAAHHRDPNGSTQLTSAGGGTARYPAGTTATFLVIMGHRNTGFTACPGRYLYPYLTSIRSRVTSLMQAALIDPSVPTGTVRQGTSLTLRAQALRNQSWRLDVSAARPPCGTGRVARISGNAAPGRPVTATWDGRVAGGRLARPGRYTLTLTSSSRLGAALPVTTTVLVLPPRTAARPAATPSSRPGYVPLTPARLHDTRSGSGVGPGAPLGSRCWAGPGCRTRASPRSCST